MTKSQHIRELYKAGVRKQRRIVELTGYSYRYVANVLNDIRHPGYQKSHRKSPSVKKSRVRNRKRNQRETRACAARHRQEWTDQDLAYLTMYGTTMTVRQLALDLGRSYSAVLSAGRWYGIGLGYQEKTGANAHKFQATNSGGE